MRFRLLGQLEVVDSGHAVEVGGGKRRMLLALLLLNANKVVSADRLIDELWGESPRPPRPRAFRCTCRSFGRICAGTAQIPVPSCS